MAPAETLIEATRTLTSISVQRDHAVLYFSPALNAAPESCSGVNAALAVTVDLSASGADKSIFAAALAAFHAGAQVGFVVKGCGADSLPQVVRLNVKP